MMIDNNNSPAAGFLAASQQAAPFNPTQGYLVGTRPAPSKQPPYTC